MALLLINLSLQIRTVKYKIKVLNILFLRAYINNESDVATMSKYHLAVDIGASSGRIIAGWIENNKLKTKEIHRFKNGTFERDGHIFWDIDRLYDEIQAGIKKIDTPYASIGVDTWGVDYVLLDEKGNRLSDVYAYRDHRTDGIIDTLDKEQVYGATGIQFNNFNTLFQLIAHSPKTATHFMTVPDYLHYRLCGRIACEYSIATTTQLLNIGTGQWDEQMVGLTGFPMAMFPEIVPSGTVLGTLIGNDSVKVITPAAHDTGSAVAAVPTNGGNFAYISSGTWSLMGIESKTPCMKTQEFTNEGGANGKLRVLKNIMGLWMIQEVQRLLPEKLDFATLALLAEEKFGSIVNVSDNRFLLPGNMITEIQSACRETGQPIPETPAQLARCIFDSLAESYKNTLIQLRQYQTIDKIHIIGGGSQNRLLNRLCAKATGCTVYAGPVEATAIGNIIVQMIAMGELADLEQGRALVANSFELEIYN